MNFKTTENSQNIRGA